MLKERGGGSESGGEGIEKSKVGILGKVGGLACNFICGPLFKQISPFSLTSTLYLI